VEKLIGKMTMLWGSAETAIMLTLFGFCSGFVLGILTVVLIRMSS
jgi:hypothetical protein